MTPGALAAFFRNRAEPQEYLDRHLRGDWGNVPAVDAAENEYSVTHGFRILSSYTLSDGTSIWLITEADRSMTSFLLSEEY